MSNDDENKLLILGHRLELSRIRQGMTYEQLAGKTGCAKGYLCQLARGHKNNPSLTVVVALGEALGISVGYLLGEVPDPAPAAYEPGPWLESFKRFLQFRSEVQVSAMSIEQRVALLLRFLLSSFPDRFPKKRLAQELGISSRHLGDILAGSTDLTSPFLRQLSQVSQVPIWFFSDGTFSEPRPPQCDLSYADVFRLAANLNIGPDELVSMIHARRL